MRRVQLAVVAHIRHIYTSYDRLLKTGTYHDARAKVEQPCLDQLMKWRRDDDDDPNAMEEILREVIVIPDDDDDEESHHSAFSGHQRDDRDNSVEIISSHAFEDDVQTRPLDYGSLQHNYDENRQRSPDIVSGETVRYVRKEQNTFDHQIRHDQQRHDRMELHRHRAWEEALGRRRKNPNVLYTMDSRPAFVEDRRLNKEAVFQDPTTSQFQRLEGMAPQLQMVEPMRYAGPKKPISYHAVPSQRRIPQVSYTIDQSKAVPREKPELSGQVSEVYPSESLEPLSLDCD